jgi:hypothetical protein
MILSEILGRAPRRLVKIVLRDSATNMGHPQELNGLDEADIESLQRKGAYNTPSPDIW